MTTGECIGVFATGALISWGIVAGLVRLYFRYVDRGEH